MHHRPGHAGGPGGGDDGGGDNGGTPMFTLADAMTAGEFGASVSENQRRITVSTGSGGPGVGLDFSRAYGAIRPLSATTSGRRRLLDR